MYVHRAYHIRSVSILGRTQDCAQEVMGQIGSHIFQDDLPELHAEQGDGTFELILFSW